MLFMSDCASASASAAASACLLPPAAACYCLLLLLPSGDPKGVMFHHTALHCLLLLLPLGDPKGVMLQHRAVIAGVAATDAYRRSNGLTFQAGDRLLSYLPLAHIYDRYGCSMAGEGAWIP